ncbi:MAG: Rieske 2Fe-2S domain-containing protein, partial [Planctomycetota bacterium]
MSEPTHLDPEEGARPERPWSAHWFPIAFERDLEPGRVDRVQVGARAVALYLDGDGAPAALEDRCPHRAARLSDGRVTESGTLECLYHGWEFERDGRCTGAPQQPADRALPARACARPVELCVEQGIVWAWGGAPGAGRTHARPTVAALDGSALHTVDFTMDLPYGQDFFVENVLDVAHIHIAHSGTRGGGHRSLAGPLEFDVEDRGARGFSSSLRTTGLDGAQRT